MTKPQPAVPALFRVNLRDRRRQHNIERAFVEQESRLVRPVFVFEDHIAEQRAKAEKQGKAACDVDLDSRLPFQNSDANEDPNDPPSGAAAGLESRSWAW